MNKSHRSLTVEEAKIKASILLKSFSSNATEKTAKRFKRLPEFAGLSTNEILQTKIKRKQALELIAFENNFKSWADLKCQIPFIHGGFLNHWFANYAAAKAYQETNGGFLLPYKRQFFICDSNYIQNLGLNPKDRDWKLIAYDWVEPANKSAWQRLYKMWMKLQENKS